ncbi:MAG TPA: poly(A) polymerase, partial [Archangium sp.]
MTTDNHAPEQGTEPRPPAPMDTAQAETTPGPLSTESSSSDHELQGPDIEPHRLDPDAVRVLLRLRQHGYEAYLVGGCVRDLLIGLEPKDFDIATSATPNQV